MALIALISKQGAVTAGETVGQLEASLEILSGALVVGTYTAIFSPPLQPRPSGPAISAFQRNVDAMSDFAVDIVEGPPGMTQAQALLIPPIRLRPPASSVVAYSWQLDGMDNILYAKLP